MNHFVKLLFCIITITNPSCILGAINCVMRYYENNEQFCTFYGVETSEAAPYFEPTYEDPFAVENVRIHNVIMPVLTDELCKTFPNLTKLSLQNCSMVQIEEDALFPCTKLQSINVINNLLTEVPRNVFRNCTNLIDVNLGFNSITYLNMTMFDYTKNVSVLYLGGNHFTNINLMDMPVMENVVEFDIAHTNLLELDEVNLVTKFPKLQTLYIVDNLFYCENLKIMIDVFEKNNISLRQIYDFRVPHFVDNLNRTLVKNVECLVRSEHLRASNVLVYDENEKIISQLRAEIKMKRNELTDRKAIGDKVTYYIITSAGMIMICMTIITWLGYSFRQLTKAVFHYEDSYYYYISTNANAGEPQTQ